MNRNILNTTWRQITHYWGRLLVGIFILGWASLAMAEVAVLESVNISATSGDKVLVKLHFSGPVVDPQSFSIQNPARVAIDINNAKSGLKDKKQILELGPVRSVDVVDAGQRVRVVLNLTDLVAYHTQTQGSEVLITLNSASTSQRTVTKDMTFPSKSVGGYQGAHSINNIDFRRGKVGDGRVIISLSNPNTSVDIKEEGQKIRVNFLNTTLSERLVRRLDVADFGTPIQVIDTTRNGSNVSMLIQASGNYEQLAYQADKQFVIEVKPLTQQEKEDLQKKKFIYSGERLSLNFQDIDVRAVLQLIADFTNLNLVASDAVKGNVTLRLQNVPWDQALDIVLRTKGLDKRQAGNVIIVAPAEEIAAREKQELQASQQLEDLAPLKTEFIQINYAKAKDFAELLKAQKNTILSSRGNVTVDERTNTLLVQDTVQKLDEIHALITRLDKPVRQVLIEARIVNANKDFEEDLGVRFGVNSNPHHVFRRGDGGISGNITDADTTARTGTPTNLDTPLNRLNLNLPAPGSTVASGKSPSSLGLALAKLPGGTLLDLELSALESESRGKIISSPRLITSNQKEAHIERGEEIPYQNATSSGATSVEFKKAVLSLKVTPQITPDDKIILDLKVNKDARGVDTAAGPAINTNEVESQVLVDNGQTVVLGGVYEQTVSNQVNRIPFLGKLPLVGVLFRDKKDLDQRSELLVFITPKIIAEALARS